MQFVGAQVIDRGHEYTAQQTQQFAKLTAAAVANRTAEKHPGFVDIAGHLVPWWWLGVAAGGVVAAGAGLLWWATRR